MATTTETNVLDRLNVVIDAIKCDYCGKTGSGDLVFRTSSGGRRILPGDFLDVHSELLDDAAHAVANLAAASDRRRRCEGAKGGVALLQAQLTERRSQLADVNQERESLRALIRAELETSPEDPATLEQNAHRARRLETLNARASAVQVMISEFEASIDAAGGSDATLDAELRAAIVAESAARARILQLNAEIVAVANANSR